MAGAPTLTAAQLCAGLPASVRQDLIDPLCVAALNTPAAQASAGVLLRVLRDALFGGPGAADLLLPRVTLDALLPGPAAACCWPSLAGDPAALAHAAAPLPLAVAAAPPHTAPA